MARGDWGGKPAKSGAVVAGVIWVLAIMGGWRPWEHPLALLMSFLAAVMIGWFIGMLIGEA